MVRCDLLLVVTEPSRNLGSCLVRFCLLINPIQLLHVAASVHGCDVWAVRAVAWLTPGAVNPADGVPAGRDTAGVAAVRRGRLRRCGRELPVGRWRSLGQGSKEGSISVLKIFTTWLARAKGDPSECW